MKRSNCRRYHAVVVLSVLLVLTLAFIWGHSMVSAESSTVESQQVGRWVTPVLEWFVGAGNVSGRLVRKLAHFCEYGVLGVLLGALALKWKGQRTFFRGSYIFLCALAVAVIDESIQLFADGRSAQVQDILLDTAGSLTGLLLVWLAALILRAARGRSNEL